MDAHAADYAERTPRKGDIISFSIDPLLRIFDSDEKIISPEFEDIIRDQLLDLREGREQVLIDASELDSQVCLLQS